MPMTNDLANKLANATLRNTSYTSPATVYAALYSVAPTASTAGTEITGNGYSRQSVTFSAPTAGAASSNVAVTWSCTGNAWPSVVAFGICDASTSGNIMFYQNIATRNLKPGDDLVIDSGKLTIDIG
jgi:hypothetical protein